MQAERDKQMASSQSDLCLSRISTDSPGSLISDVDYVDPEETAILSNAVCRQTKYGSTSSHTFHNQKFITHVVMPADTLQGIALKYSVTMEQIRRANRLFPSDTLFCKSVLSIPVPRVKKATSTLTNSDSSRHPDSSSDTESEAGISYNNSIYNSSDDIPFTMGSSSASISLTRLNGSNNSRLKVSKNAKTNVESPEESANDFLSRIDNSIARSKDQMASRLRSSQSHYNIKPSNNLAGPSRSQSMGLSTSPLNESALDETTNGREESPAAAAAADQLPSLCIKARESKVHYSKKRVSSADTQGDVAL